MNTIRHWFLTLCGILLTLLLQAQQSEGTVSYTSTNQVYVRFQSTGNIRAGDTLFAVSDAQVFLPALLVVNKSSVSVVCTRLGNSQPQKGDRMLHFSAPDVADVPENDKLPVPDSLQQNIVTAAEPDSLVAGSGKQAGTIRGRLALSSYTGIRSGDPTVSQRMRYTLAFRAERIGGTGLSAETYVTFSHRDHQWDDIREDVFNGLKIYALALQYQINKAHQVSFGRKINPQLAQMGVNDGLQYAFTHRHFTLGLLAGSRPDQQNFSLNTGLLQAGAYLSHATKTNRGTVQSTAAFVEQTNKGNTDRRYVYLQHANSLLPKLYFFGSVEIDLYKKVNDVSQSQFQLSNAFASLRYRPIPKLSLSLSYSNRQPIIYYETYKTIVEQLLEQASTQGVNFHADYRPFRKWAFGFRAGYRSNALDARASGNLHAYTQISMIPRLEASALLSYTRIATPWLDGDIYSLSLAKDLFDARMNLSAGYRYIQYAYLSGEFTQTQHLGELGLNYRLKRKFYISLNTEHTIEKASNTHRIYLGLTQRF